MTEPTYELMRSLVHAAFSHTSDANETYLEVTNAIMEAAEENKISEQTASYLIEAADIECEAHL